MQNYQRYKSFMWHNLIKQTIYLRLCKNLYGNLDNQKQRNLENLFVDLEIQTDLLLEEEQDHLVRVILESQGKGVQLDHHLEELGKKEAHELMRDQK